MNQAIEHFIDGLARVKTAGNLFNQYSYDLSVNSIRRNNLLLYLQQMKNLNPQMLLVGEAPGYRGCRLTGVPFTSESILLNGLETIDLFGEERGYQKTNEFETLRKEATATIVWATLAKALDIPLIWNAVPFHPFQIKQPLSNRQPTKAEVTMSRFFLQELIQLFDIKVVVAIGNTAESTLKATGIACLKVRHPSYGGKTIFIDGLNDVINTQSSSMKK